MREDNNVSLNMDIIIMVIINQLFKVTINNHNIGNLIVDFINKNNINNIHINNIKTNIKNRVINTIIKKKHNNLLIWKINLRCNKIENINMTKRKDSIIVITNRLSMFKSINKKQQYSKTYEH